jgi:hypothetical protein
MAKGNKTRYDESVYAIYTHTMTMKEKKKTLKRKHIRCSIFDICEGGRAFFPPPPLFFVVFLRNTLMEAWEEGERRKENKDYV